MGKLWIDRDIWVAYGKYADGTEVKRVFPYEFYFNVEREENAKQRIEKWLTDTVGALHNGCVEYSVKYSDCYIPEDDGEEYSWEDRNGI